MKRFSKVTQIVMLDKKGRLLPLNRYGRRMDTCQRVRQASHRQCLIASPEVFKEVGTECWGGREIVVVAPEGAAGLHLTGVDAKTLISTWELKPMVVPTVKLAMDYIGKNTKTGIELVIAGNGALLAETLNYVTHVIAFKALYMSEQHKGEYVLSGHVMSQSHTSIQFRNEGVLLGDWLYYETGK